jgi:phage head maturation protease
MKKLKQKKDDLKKLYAEISKVEEQDDGTLKVWGFASSEAVDSDGETITSDAMKAAIPDYMKFGAVREMHQPIAAGTAIEASVDDMGKTFFGAHVVDPVAVKKVQTGTYKGFSIGGKVTERDELNKSIIKGIRLVEVSLVDRPANPEAVFTMYKVDDLEGLQKTDEAPAAEPTEKLDAVVPAEEPLKKGMYHVSGLSNILQSISWIASDTEWESQYEGDNSPLPQALRDWLAQGCGILQSMVAEEIVEMITGLQAMVPTPEPAPMQMSEGTGDLEKVGATLSASTKATLKVIKETIAAAMGHLEALLSVEQLDPETKAEDIEDLQKTITDTQELAKQAEENLVKLGKENETLKKRITDLEAKPAPPKGVLKAISKDADVGVVAETKEEKAAFEAMPPEEKAAHQIKKMYQGR